MLYIFHVDTGRMMTFEMDSTLKNVKSLKHTIEQIYKIPAMHQVLLISGGVMLQMQEIVGSYSAGTDTNPIFMFSTANMDPRNPIEPWPSIDKGKDKQDSEHELKIQVDHCLDLPNNIQTVVARAQLSQQICEMAKREFSECEELVYEQHLQQQGWASVVANMEDLTNEFHQRNEDFYRHFNDYLVRREEYIEFLTHFSDDLLKLANIPILPGLVHNAEEKPFDAFNDMFKEAAEHFTKYDSSGSGNDKSDTSGGESSVSCAKRKRLPSMNVGDGAMQVDGKTVAAFTLLQWILASENQKSLREMASNCHSGLERLDQSVLDKLKADAQSNIESAQREDMKEIKGLSDRLSGLEKLMSEAREVVAEQQVLSQSFQQNQARAANLGDASILPDLCASHRSQLLVMVRNHNKLKDYRRRCAKSKDELCKNIHKRLTFIVQLENKISELDNKLLFYHRNIKRLQKHLGIIEQIHHAPCIYVTAVTEVVRRRIFSSAFLMWASNLACHLLTIHNEEVMRRHEFAAAFEGHFLCSLFPGMNDMPPTYATEAPSIFDSSLPNLSENDIKELSHFLPELTSKVQLPDLGAVIEFFTSRSGNHDRNNSSSSDAKESSMTDESKHRLPSTRPIDIHSHLKEYEKGFESETDTEEFEKVTQSPQQKSHQAAKPVITTTTMATSTSNVETCSTSTSTERVATQSTETLTEVRIPFIKHSLSDPNPVTNTSATPKKPLRIKKLTYSPYSISKSLSDSSCTTLPSIPENSSSAVGVSHVQSKSLRAGQRFCERSSSAESAGTQASTSGDGMLIDGEFINSEFYIDESLPSSLCEDRDGDDGVVGRDSDSLSNFNESQSMMLLQENLGTTRLEVERLKTLLKTMYELSRGTLSLLKEQLANIKTQTDDDRHEINRQIDKLSRTYQEYNDHIDGAAKCREQERVQRLTELEMNHELEMNDIKMCLQTLQSEKMLVEARNSEEVVQHAREKVALSKSMDLLQDRVGQLERQVAEAKRDRDQAVKEERDRLSKEHKTEIESLRCKFRLMTNLERSPSDTSLEKIEKPVDTIELTNHEAIVAQLRKTLEIEKEQAVKAAIDRCMARSEYSRASMLSSSPRSPSSNPDMYKRILDEKERQLDQLREREAHLLDENRRCKDRIQSLADSDITSSHTTEMMERIDNMQKEKQRLEQELEKERRKRVKLTQNQISALRGGTFTTSSCAEGANVLVVWNFQHEQYTIAQDSPVLYFLHAESYQPLNLTPTVPGQVPMVLHCFGIVETKEYCHARRDENRYKVSKGTKFYRVKVQPRPLTSRSETERSCSHRKERKSSTSEPVSRSMSTETCNQSGLLIDSFAQTEILVPLLEDSATSRDMIDSGVQGVEQRAFYKERNISVTEEDEPTSLILDQLRCESVSEEITLTEGDTDEDGRPSAAKLLETSSDSAKMDESDDFRSLPS